MTALIVTSAFGSLALFLFRQSTGVAPRDELIASFRSNLRRSILLGLEFPVAADIINTVAVEPTIQSLLMLARIVMIRTFLRLSLKVEIDGRCPWQKAQGKPWISEPPLKVRIDPDPDIDAAVRALQLRPPVHLRTMAAFGTQTRATEIVL